MMRLMVELHATESQLLLQLQISSTQTLGDHKHAKNDVKGETTHGNGNVSNIIEEKNSIAFYTLVRRPESIKENIFAKKVILVVVIMYAF